MTPADAAEILTLAAAFDRRTVGHADATAWADALNGLRPSDCAEAVRRYYSESTEWLMPGHVRAMVKRIRAERIQRAVEDVPAADADPDDIAAYLAALRKERRRVANGDPDPPRVALPKRDVGKLLGEAVDRLEPVKCCDDGKCDVCTGWEGRRD